MSRHLVYLNSLFSKMKGRYGEDDEAVRQLGVEVEKLKEVETAHLARRRPPTSVAMDQAPSAPNQTQQSGAPRS